jgi:putative ABC transport system substrate-binding protein
MRRRNFIIGLGASVAAWPVVVSAQQAMPVIGLLGAGALSGYTNQTVAFRQGLNESGFIPGQNVTIEYRWAEGRYDILPTLASDLVNRHAAVIATSGGLLSTHAAKEATATIPIIFTSATDPVAAGLVTSLSRPEGNVTGVSFSSGLLSGKRLELIRELVPHAKTIAALYNPRNPGTKPELTDLRSAAAAVGQQLRHVAASTKDEIDQAFAQFGQERPDALVVMQDLFFTGQRDQIVALAGRSGVPAIYSADYFTRAGGLLSYGASPTAAYRQTGVYVGRILKGAKPAELPVLLPSKFELVVNLKTAKALGLNIPETFLLYRADEVIE